MILVEIFWFFSKTTTASSDVDPFVVLESTTSSGLFVDPLDEFAASVSSQPSQALKPPPKPTQKVDRGY